MDLGVLLLVAAALVAVLGAVAAVMAVLSVRRRFASSNEVVPGVATRAPVAWAGAHTIEARLHRRLRDAVTSTRSLADPAGDLLEARSALEQQALAVDDRLVAVAALPEQVRAEPLATVTAAVQAVEEAAAALVQQRSGLRAPTDRLDQALADLAERAALLDAARAEVEAVDRPDERTIEPPPAPSRDHPQPG